MSNPSPNRHADIDNTYLTKVDDEPPSEVSRRGDDHAPAAPAADEPTSFFSLANLNIAKVSILGGMLNGYSIGFVGVYTFLYTTSTDCSLFTGEASCATLSNAKCVWRTGGASGPHCAWANELTCGQTYFTTDACLADSKCQWSYSDGVCKNPTGISSALTGIFAAAMILGCMIGSLAGPLVKRLGFKLTFTLIGLVALAMSVLYHVAVAVDQFWLLCAARLVIGVPVGVVNVAAPMYVGERASPKYAKMLGMCFQISTCFGQFIAALIGLALGQTIHYNADGDQRMIARMQGLCAPSTFIAFAIIILGLFLDGFGFRGSKVATVSHTDADADAAEKKPKGREYTFCQMIPRLLMGIVAAATLQLVGINAVMNFAPNIMRSFGLAPMVGNVVVIGWNFITPMFSIFLASKLTMRHMFLLGTISTGCACLFMCGVPVFPGVTSNSAVKDGVAITGILLFIAGFQFFVGTSFFVVMFDLFPPSFAPRGASFTLFIMFIFNIIINVSYSIAVEGLSGGPSGDQDKGQAIAFMFFGGVGVVCFILEFFFMHAWVEPTTGGKADSYSDFRGPHAENRVEAD